MISRCRNPKAGDYARYGAIGVTVCDAWVEGAAGRGGLSLFFEHIGPKPSPDYSLDRIDNARGYEPGNVRWASSIEQQNNKRNNRLVIYRGQQMTVAQAVRVAGSVIEATHAYRRIGRGWTVEAAVETSAESTKGTA